MNHKIVNRIKLLGIIWLISILVAGCGKMEATFETSERSPAEPGLDLVGQAGLEQTTAIDVWVEGAPLFSISDPAQIEKMVAVLAAPLRLETLPACSSAYTLSFRLRDGSQHEFYYGCSWNNPQVFWGSQGFWDDKVVQVPQNFSQLFLLEAASYQKDVNDGPPAPVMNVQKVVLNFLNEQKVPGAPSLDLDWNSEVVISENLVGSGEYHFQSGDWQMQITYPIVAPTATLYQAAVINETTGFEWLGEVDSMGQVRPHGWEGDGIKAVGWYGYVVSTPPESQYDDFLVLWPEGTAEIGLAGTTPEVDQQIAALRDKPMPGKNAHFWGALHCDVMDYGGCQLQVEKLRVDGISDFFPPEVVAGWEGTLVSVGGEPHSGGDDYLLVETPFSLQYGIDGRGEMRAQLESLRDTGAIIRVWGELTCGIPDVGGCQILVENYEIVREGVAGVTTESNQSGVSGWLGVFGRNPNGFQYSYYFDREDGERFIVSSQDFYEQVGDAAWLGARVEIWGELVDDMPGLIDVSRIIVKDTPFNEMRNLSYFARVSASSELAADRGGTYHAWSAVDGDLGQPWAEGVDGPGIGQWLLLAFPGEFEVSAIGMDIGYDAGTELFKQNHRIRSVTLVFANDESVKLEFKDEQGIQLIPLARAPGPAIRTSFIKVIIDDIYTGTGNDDTCLGEIEVWGITP